MKHNLLKLLINNRIIYLALYLFFFPPFTGSAEENQNLKKPTVYDTQDNPPNIKILDISESEFKDASKLDGFVWSPFVLPTDNLTITNAALYKGYWQKNQKSPENKEDKTFFPPPKEGTCVVFKDSNVMDKMNPNGSNPPINTEEKNYHFINKNAEQAINTALFFITDSEQKIIAVARLNAKGESECSLNTPPYSVSIGYGRQRNEIKISSKSNIINLEFKPTSTLRINPTLENNIQNGDIVRVGRKINLDFSKKYHEFDNIIIPIKIYSDLYNHADMASHDLSVDEYMTTSFLVGNSRYQIELEQGQYVAAVLRKNKLVCFNQFAIKTNTPYNLSCKNTKNIKKTKEEIAYQFDFEDTIFDVGFRPKNLIKNKTFVSWTTNTPGTILLGSPILDSNETTPTSKNSDDSFSIVFKSKDQFLQTNYGTSLDESIHTFKVPLKGMSRQHLLEGQVPFSEYILVKSQKYSVPYFMNRTNTIHTNGAEISILEPTMTNAGNLFASTDQKFFIRITVPKFNTTEILEMFINNKLTKRWILKRGNISEPFSITQNITTYENKNFKVKFVARGESSLSNFLTGRDNFLPFAETREFCVSIDGKENCS